VTEPAEVTAIVDKTIRYQAAPEFGPWRNRMLWITSEQPGFIQMSDQLADIFSKEGFAPEKVYPPPDAAAAPTTSSACARPWTAGTCSSTSSATAAASSGGPGPRTGRSTATCSTSTTSTS
jgi:hypothetical protein